MRERDAAPAALIGAIVCCGAMALIAGLVGGVALAVLGRFTVVSVAGLGVVVLIAWVLDRRRQRHVSSGDADDRSRHLEEVTR